MRLSGPYGSLFSYTIVFLLNYYTLFQKEVQAIKPFLSPDYIFASITAITPNFLKTQGITTLLLDVDNTLTVHGSQNLSPNVSAWLEIMRSNNIKMIIVSNNTKKRVKPFANAINLDFKALCIKPSPFSLSLATKSLKANKKNVALVGDQVFTDMFAAHFYGVPCFLVEPMHQDTVWTIRLKRALEKPFIALYYKKGKKRID